MLSRNQKKVITSQLEHTDRVMDEVLSDLETYVSRHYPSLSTEDQWLLSGSIDSLRFVRYHTRELMDEMNQLSRFQRFIQFFRK